MGISLVSKYTPIEVIFNGDLLAMKIKITYLILSPSVICYFGPILIFDLDHFFGDLPYLCKGGYTSKTLSTLPRAIFT